MQCDSWVLLLGLVLLGAIAGCCWASLLVLLVLTITAAACWLLPGSCSVLLLLGLLLASCCCWVPQLLAPLLPLLLFPANSGCYYGSLFCDCCCIQCLC